MDASLRARLGSLSFAVLLIVGAQAAQADTFVGGTNVWTMVGTPSFVTSRGNPLAVVSFSSHVSVTVTAIVIMVLRNSAGQTVYFSTGSVAIATGTIGAVEIIEFGQPPGTYNATFFAFTFGGVAISLPTSALFTIPR
ncbi:MAG TPA: hypothetical protein VND40_02620 [Nitrososphaerales archaeon]|nr:hypothetical protein [Nitrososphaerales archaeon]